MYRQLRSGRMEIIMKKALCLFLIIMTVCAGFISVYATENSSNNNIAVPTEFEQSVIDEVCSQVVESYEEIIQSHRFPVLYGK